MLTTDQMVDVLNLLREASSPQLEIVSDHVNQLRRENRQFEAKVRNIGLRVGDDAQFTSTVSPKYLAGVRVRIVKDNDKSFGVKLLDTHNQRAASRLGTGTIRCPKSIIEPISGGNEGGVTLTLPPVPESTEPLGDGEVRVVTVNADGSTDESSFTLSNETQALLASAQAEYKRLEEAGTPYWCTHKGRSVDHPSAYYRGDDPSDPIHRKHGVLCRDCGGYIQEG